MLPPEHPLTRHVRRVVTRILEANNLGSLEDVPRMRAPSTLDVLLGRAESMPEGSWDPDASPHGVQVGTEGAAVGPNRKWNLIVVKDDKEVNAMATPGRVWVEYTVHEEG